MKASFWRSGQLVFGLILLLFSVYLLWHFAELKNVSRMLWRIKWSHLVTLLLLEFLFLVNRGQIFCSLYRRVHLKLTVFESTLMFVAAYALNILVPSAGVSGAAVYLAAARAQKISKSRILLILLLFYFIGFVALAALLMVAFLYLYTLQGVRSFYLVSFALLLSIIISFVAVFFWSIRNKTLFLKICAKLILLANWVVRFLRLPALLPEGADHLYQEIVLLREMLSGDCWLFWEPFSYFLLGNVYEILILAIIFWALGTHLPLMAVAVGYGIGLLFMLISVTPAGVGVVEPLMVLAFISLGATLEVSAAAVVVFRAVTFWLPLPFGVTLTRRYLS